MTIVIQSSLPIPPFLGLAKNRNGGIGKKYNLKKPFLKWVAVLGGRTVLIVILSSVTIVILIVILPSVTIVIFIVILGLSMWGGTQIQTPNHPPEIFPRDSNIQHFINLSYDFTSNERFVFI